ncbi:MAG: hypothetical protein V3S72_04460 [Desulfobacterales bacterium]
MVLNTDTVLLTVLGDPISQKKAPVEVMKKAVLNALGRGDHI